VTKTRHTVKPSKVVNVRSGASLKSKLWRGKQCEPLWKRLPEPTVCPVDVHRPSAWISPWPREQCFKVVNHLADRRPAKSDEMRSLNPERGIGWDQRTIALRLRRIRKDVTPVEHAPIFTPQFLGYRSKFAGETRYEIKIVLKNQYLL
jgi:hypothetical protein